LLGARFEYFDGLDWYDTWGDESGKKAATSNRDQPNLAGLPEAVRVTLWFDSDPQAKPAGTTESQTNVPMVFQTVARLMLADVKQPSGGSGSSDDTSQQGQTTPNTSGMPAGMEN
jgi:hypothetical protein